MLKTEVTDQTSSCVDSENPVEFLDGCLFCELPEEKFEVIDENELCLTLRDSYPVTPGHCLIIPRRHVETYFDMSPEEIAAATRIIHRARKRLQTEDESISGFNIGTNAGKSAGQSVFHAHIHLIPRRDGDQENPQGGVRKLFPDKAHYRK
jgi:diadenosine tetraphosphate (Ap4A) HIT family hydrolase